ncbi:MAG: aspartate carbamoyltransferase [Eubacteriales bacterium]|nr:aspartate carbamoyltransferase [Eubacteriales bacterium]MDY3332965.1 aspartate carbamoyltransferase [Gallibacter sp.]
MKHLINILDFSISELDELMTVADDIIDNPEKYSNICNGKQLATLFYEPSTRTRLSFESAMLSLGGKVIGFSDSNSSSVSKGESLADTISIVSGYVDIIAMRHPIEGAPYIATSKSLVPFINAGDGSHFHPTQTLADLLTIHRTLKRFDNLKIALCGDLKYGRTVHSLIDAMSRYENNEFVLISPAELELSPSYIKELEKKNIKFTVTDKLEGSIDDVDILYMTRVQKERFDDIEEYERLKDVFVLDKEKLDTAKEDMIVLHPLPRVNEISVDVDDDKRTMYFEQAYFGKYIRMALILNLLGLSDNKTLKDKLHYTPDNTFKNCIITEKVCSNNKCITKFESNINRYARTVDGVEMCYYCDKEL